MKNFLIAICFILSLGAGFPAFSDDGATLYATRGCIGCHGVGGNAPVAPNYPKIGKQNKEYTINQLNDFKNGKRTNGLSALMMGMAAALTEQDIANLAEYLATGSGAN